MCLSKWPIFGLWLPHNWYVFILFFILTNNNNNNLFVSCLPPTCIYPRKNPEEITWGNILLLFIIRRKKKMIPSNKANRCLSAATEMLSRVFEIPNLKFPLLVSKLFHLLSQPTPPPPLSHCPHPTPSLIPWLSWLIRHPGHRVSGTSHSPDPWSRISKLVEIMVENARHLAKASERRAVSRLSSPCLRSPVCKTAETR